jgi:hypothetical protein
VHRQQHFLLNETRDGISAQGPAQHHCGSTLGRVNNWQKGDVDEERGRIKQLNGSDQATERL